MKRGSEISLATISTVNREGTDDLKELHYAINDLMYKYNRRYISRLDAKCILASLEEFGEALDELVVTKKAEPKKAELLNSARVAWKAVNQYYKEFKWSELDIPQIQATVNFQVRRLMEAKNNNTLEGLAIKYLDENKEIYDRMVLDSNYMDRLKLDTFKEFNKQVLSIVVKKYTME